MKTAAYVTMVGVGMMTDAYLLVAGTYSLYWCCRYNAWTVSDLGWEFGCEVDGVWELM